MRIRILILRACASTAQGFSQSISLPYYTGFDSPSEKVGWQQYRTGYISSYGWGNSGKLFHGYNVGGSSGQTVIDWMVSPPMNFTVPGMISMKVMAGGFSSPTTDNCEVWFSPDYPDPAVGTYVLIGNISFMPKGQWNDTAFNIPVTTDSGYIAFKYKTVGAAWMEYSIDSIWITTPSGIGELKNQLEVTAFPNPVHSSVSLKLGSPVHRAELVLYNGIGEEVKRFKNISGQEILLNCAGWVKDLYFFQLMEGNRVRSSGKFIVN